MTHSYEDVFDVDRIKDIIGLLPVRPKALLQALSQNIMPIIEKGLVDATIVHKLLAEYLQYADKVGFPNGDQLP